MPDDESDWMPLYEVIKHVEETQQFYHGKARATVEQALDRPDVRSRTVHGPPRLVTSFWGGSEVIHEAPGEIIEIRRDDVFRMWPPGRDRSLPPTSQGSTARAKRSRPVTEGIVAAIKDLWPDGVPAGLRRKEVLNFIEKWLKQRNLSVSTNLAKAVERVAREYPELWKEPTAR